MPPRAERRTAASWVRTASRPATANSSRQPRNCRCRRIPPLKDAKDFRILGKGLTRIDTPAKVNGSAGFGIDVKLPGLLTAVMAHAPVPGAKIVSVDDAAAKAIPGVKQVVQIPQGVAVLADSYWTALKGRDALVVKWDEGALGSLSSAGISKLLTDATMKPGAVARSEGDVGVAVAKTIEAVYEAPYLAHACMEPMNCTAWVRAGEAEVWAPTQGPGPHQGIVAQLTGLPPEKVQVHTTYLGGGFGRRFAPDFVIAATLISKAAGAPVKLVYTREDDMRAWFYRPASVTRFTAGLDAAGNPVSFTARVASPALSIAAGFAKELPKGIDEAAVEGIGDMLYAFPNLRVEYARAEPGIQSWFWRSVGHSQNVYFIEAFIDEIAAAAGKDPVEFRRSLLGKQPRLRGVLDLAAEKAGWGTPLPKGVHRGVALTSCFGSFVAQVAEVSVDASGKPRVHRIVAAVDCGRTVNPDMIQRQVEGAVVYGLSAALHEKITFKNGRVEQSNFDDYPMLRMDEMPRVEVHIVPSTEAPGGIGEPGSAARDACSDQRDVRGDGQAHPDVADLGLRSAGTPGPRKASEWRRRGLPRATRCRPGRHSAGARCRGSRDRAAPSCCRRAGCGRGRGSCDGP